MTKFIILNKEDMLTLCDNKPVTCYIDKKHYVLCTEECFEKWVANEAFNDNWEYNKDAFV